MKTHLPQGEINSIRRTILRAAGLAALAPGLAACRFEAAEPIALASSGVPFLQSGGAAANVNYANTIAAARIAILDSLKASNTASASVALLDGDSIVWSETFGYVDADKKTLPGLDTVYCIGSVSKVFAATATMILVDRGLLALDAPVVDVLPGFSMLDPDYRKITPRMLLSHSSGLPGTHVRNAFTFAAAPGYLEQCLDNLKRSTLKHPPGEMAVYCNDGFTVIEAVIAALSGKSYPQFVSDEILQPLGMTNSRYALAPLPAGSYAPSFDEGRAMQQEYVQLYASGGLYSTPREMLRFAMMFINGGRLGDTRILSAQAVAEMGTDQTPRLTFEPLPGFSWGLGWDCARHPGLAAAGVLAWQKNGGTLQYGTDFFVLPKERMAVLVTASSTSAKTGKLGEAILLDALAERGSLAKLPPLLPSVPGAAVAANEAELAELNGYFAAAKALYRVEPQADRSLTITHIDAAGSSIVGQGLKLRSDGYYCSDDSAATAYGTLLGQGRRYLTMRSVSGSGRANVAFPYAERIAPRAPLSAAWQARLGRRWVAVDEAPASCTTVLVPPLLSLETQPALPGHLFVKTVAYQAVDASQSDRVARMFLKIPVDAGRDLSDLIVETRQINGRDEEWLRWSGNLYRPLEHVPVPDYFIKLDGEGNCEWRRIPAATTLNIATSGDWRLYDKDFTSLAAGSGSVRGLQAPANAWLRIFGEPHSVAWLS